MSPAATAEAAPARSPSLEFDADLIRKYDGFGPRYTSYPTADRFHAGFGEKDYREHLAIRNASRSAQPLSLYVHLPFCNTICYYCACNKVITSNRSRAAPYVQRIEQEVARVADLIEGVAPVVQVHWGGGTPTFLPARELGALGALLRDAFPFDPEVEFGVEVDPRRCTDEQLDALAAAGVNRLSMGVQDVDPRVQQAVHRVQPFAETRAVVEGARARGIRSLNVDLIYGLPHQTAASFARTVEAVLALRPDRFAIFNFAYLPDLLRHQRALDAGAMPSPDEKLTILEDVVTTLTGAGYVFIGMDHFARPEDPLAQELRARTLVRNFQGYSTHGEADLIGLGASSIGQLGGGYAQNERTVGGYQEMVRGDGLATRRGLLMQPDDELRREIIVRLMCHFRVEKAAIEERFAVDFDDRFAGELARLQPLAADGLVELRPDRIEVTSLGRLLVRNVAMAFDAYLQRPGQRFSRTV